MINAVMCHKENDILIRIQDKNGIDYDRRTSDDMQDFFSTYFLNFTESTILWVQDLRLYAESIIMLLYAMGWTDVTLMNPSAKNMPSKSFKYAIEVRGNAYYILVRNRKHTVYIYNTDNLLAGISDDEIVKDFGNGTQLEDINDRQLTHLKSLVDASFSAILRMDGFQAKRTPFTISMLAMRQWKKIEDLYTCGNLVDCKKFDAPGEAQGSLSEYIRKSYHGGWNYLNDKIDRSEYKDKDGAVYDVNSLYPFIMATKPLPWGQPQPFKGSEIPRKDDPNYYYYVRVRMTFDLKEGDHFPYIQKRGDFRYRFMDYLTTSDIIKIDNSGAWQRISKIIGIDGKPQDVIPEFVLSKTDYELIHRHYDVHFEEILDGVVFRTSRSIFKHYVGNYYSIKQKAGRTGATGEKRIAKMLLNGLSGTLAKREKRVNLVYREKNGHFETEPMTAECQSASYIHIASAILSYAREYTYEAACQNADSFLYSDTDSLHLIGYARGIEIDPDALGKWKLEKTFTDACYMKRKSYVLKTDDVSTPYQITMAGIPYGYKRLIEDILNGQSLESMERLAEYTDSRYRDATVVFKKSIQYIKDRYADEGYKEVEDYVPSFYNNLAKMVRDAQEYEPTTLLLYSKYPSGITVCENFELSHKVLWEYMQPKLKVA